MKPTKKDFEYFKKCCQDYIFEYELSNWTFMFHFGDKSKSSDDNSQCAWIKRNLSNLQADIYLDNKYDFKSKDEIQKTAEHEILHCLIGHLYLLAVEREATYKEIDRVEEELVHKLEKLLSPKI